MINTIIERLTKLLSTRFLGLIGFESATYVGMDEVGLQAEIIKQGIMLLGLIVYTASEVLIKKPELITTFFDNLKKKVGK